MFADEKKDRHTPLPKGDNRLALERQLCFALYSASLAMTKLYRPYLQPMGLTFPQYLVMLVIWERDDVTLSDLAERLLLDSGTLTPLLRRLQSSGLLRRERDARDERKIRVTLTPEGRALRRRARSIPEPAAAAPGCELSELDGLTAQVTKLRDSIAVHAAI